jgi:hypothetical protein
VECEDPTGEQSARHGESSQEHNEEAGRQRVPENIDQTIADGSVAPELVLQPERRMEQRVILLGCPGFRPDSRQTGPGLQRWIRDMTGIVPEKVAAEARPVGGKDGE